jgi:hypothetical protein
VTLRDGVIASDQPQSRDAAALARQVVYLEA